LFCVCEREQLENRRTLSSMEGVTWWRISCWPGQMEERFLSEISILPGQINAASSWQMAWISCCSDYIYIAGLLCAGLLHRVLRIRDLCLESADRVSVSSSGSWNGRNGWGFFANPGFGWVQALHSQASWI